MHTEVKPKAFLKWLGGKSTLVPELLKRFPKTYGTYHEPFLGGGSLFFALRPERAHLSDANLRLVRTYAAIQRDVITVTKYLRDYYAKNHSKEFFYAARAAAVDRCPTDADVAAWFIYLNRTCFNGVYRVNSSGGFNVPFGKYKNPTICDETTLVACAAALSKPGVVIRHEDFRQGAVEGRIQAGDVVYFDPPYAPLSKTSDFTTYTAGGFGPSQQEALRDLAYHLKCRGVHVIISNSSADLIKRLYDTRFFTVDTVEVKRAVNSKVDKRGEVAEYIIT